MEVATDQVAAKGKKFTWPEIQAMFKRGNEFNKKALDKYDFNEINLADRKRLDSYIPGEEIISRKATTLSEIKKETFEGYLKELTTKYAKGKEINSTKFNIAPELLGKPEVQRLTGEYFLEIPESNKRFDLINEYESLARKYDVTIKYLAE